MPPSKKGRKKATRLPAHYQEIVDAAKRDGLATKAERAKPSYKIVHGRAADYAGGSGVQRLRVLLGATAYEHAEREYGPDLIIRAAKKIDESRRRSAVIREASRAKVEGALKKIGLTAEERERRIDGGRVYKRPAKVEFSSIKRGRYKGQFVVHREGRPDQRVKSRKLAKAIESRFRTSDKIGRIAGALSIPNREASRLVRSVEIQADRDLAKFKKSAAFRKLTPRQQRGYTKKRWRAGSVAVLFAFAEIEGY